MPIKNNNIARYNDLNQAIKDMKCFEDYPDIDWEVVTPQAYPSASCYRRGVLRMNARRDRAYIRDKTSGKILLTASSAYQLLCVILNGWKYNPNPHPSSLLGDSNESQS